MEKALDETLEESPELLQQVDGINDSDVERPGKVETVLGVPQQEVKGGGGWEVVHSQRKTRDMKAAAGGKGGRTGSLERLFPTLLLTRAVAEVEKMIEEDGVKKIMRLEEITLQNRRRWEAKASEVEKKARDEREKKEAEARRWRSYGF